MAEEATPPLTPEERRDGLLEVLALELRALTVAQLIAAGNVGVPANMLQDIEAKQQRADAIILASYTDAPWPKLPAIEAAS